MMNKLFFIFLASYSLYLCSCSPNNQVLPRYGNHDVVNGDTIYHAIPDFSFTDQEGQTVTNATFSGKVYVADFFFISCPTICPKVKKQMLRIYDRYENDDRLALLSHTIDPKRDTIERLKKYAENLGVVADKWHFVRGDKDIVYSIAEDYLSLAFEDPRAPGGFDHSGYLLLIDQHRNIRAYCNGTEEKAVDNFMRNIDRLLSANATLSD